MAHGGYILGPFIALGVIGGLALVLRWIFGDTTRRRIQRARNARQQHTDFGLLRTVAVAEDQNTAQAIRELLSTAGIRATTTGGPHGAVRILVFEHEFDRAHRVVIDVL